MLQLENQRGKKKVKSVTPTLSALRCFISFQVEIPQLDFKSRTVLLISMKNKINCLLPSRSCCHVTQVGNPERSGCPTNTLFTPHPSSAAERGRIF